MIGSRGYVRTLVSNSSQQELKHNRFESLLKDRCQSSKTTFPNSLKHFYTLRDGCKSVLFGVLGCKYHSPPITLCYTLLHPYHTLLHPQYTFLHSCYCLLHPHYTLLPAHNTPYALLHPIALLLHPPYTLLQHCHSLLHLCYTLFLFQKQFASFSRSPPFNS